MMEDGSDISDSSTRAPGSAPGFLILNELPGAPLSFLFLLLSSAVEQSIHLWQ